MINTERIEIQAKSKLEECLLKSNYALPEFTTNDKSPSWDGFIRLYSEQDSSKKENLVRRIPVQIKGHFSEMPYSNEISFPVDIVDLNNYMKECGAIYFVIYVDDKDNYKIYYDTLTRLKIRRIIKGKEKQKSVSIYLQSFPMDNPSEITEILFNFAKDMDMVLPQKDITLDDVIKHKIQGFDTFNLTYSGKKYKNDPFEYFLTHSATVSLINTFTGISFPVDTISLVFIGAKHSKSITVAKIKYYDNFEVIRKKHNNLVMRFGNSFSFELKISDSIVTGKFNFKIKGNLAERITDINFLLDYLKNKEFEVDSHKGFYLTDAEIGTVNIEYFQGNLRLLENVDALLKKLKVTTVLDYDKVSEDDEKTLILLINTVLLGATCIPDNPNTLYNLQIANINILLVANKIDDNNYTIVNYFSDENRKRYVFSYKNKTNNSDLFLIPLTFILKKCDFVSLDNIDYDMVYKDIINSQTSDELKEYTYFFVQDMIAGYSKRTKEKNLLCNCIEKSLKFLKENISEYDYENLEKNFMEKIKC